MHSRTNELPHASTPSLTSPIVRESTSLHSHLLDNSPWTAQGVTHDFNNMLSVVLSQTSVARNKLPPGSAAEENLQKAMRAVERAIELSQQLLDHLCNTEERATYLTLNCLIRKSIDLLDPSYSAYIDFHLNLDDGLPLLLANQCQIQQVIQNLLNNAAESIDRDNGTILVESCRRNLLSSEGTQYYSHTPLAAGNYVALSIHDNGVGIKPEQLEQIFEQHFTTKKDGRGIGLNTVWQIVCAHGGGIRVSSKPNKGSTFEVLLPITPSQTTNGCNGNHRLF